MPPEAKKPYDPALVDAVIDAQVDDFIDSLGWADARDHAIHEWGIPNSILIFDRAAMLEHLRGDFEFHERGGEVYVFIR